MKLERKRPGLYQYREWQIEKQPTGNWAISFSRDLWHLEQMGSYKTIQKAKSAVDKEVLSR
jgi:hypothetical protein